MNPTRPSTTGRAGPSGGRVRHGRVLILGARRHCRRLVRYLGEGPWTELPIVGFVDAGQVTPSGPLGRVRQLAVHAQSEPVPILGGIDRLDELVDRSGATHLLVAMSGRPARRLRRRIEELARPSVHVHWAGETTTEPAWLHRTLEPAGTSAPPLPWRWRWRRLAKRLLDVVGAGVGLALLSPLFLVVAAIILITSGRPVFYKQDRVGQGGRIFRMWKFRSMRQDAEVVTGPIWASDHDERCTRIGKWLRHTNIDELPQLINVLTGDMSLVGPRPERPIFVERFREVLPDYDLRHAMPMGMTGWAQVHGWRGRTSLRKRVQYDLDYIHRWTFWLDLQILLMTVEHVFWGRTSWNGPARRPER